MTFDYRLTHRKADTHPVGLGREEGIEKLVERRVADAGARISNAEDGLILVRYSSDEQSARPIFDVAHRIGSVSQKVQHYLLQLDPVALNQRRHRTKARFQNYLGAAEVAPGHGDYFLGRVIEVDGLERGFFLAEKCAES